MTLLKAATEAAKAAERTKRREELLKVAVKLYDHAERDAGDQAVMRASLLIRAVDKEVDATPAEDADPK